MSYDISFQLHAFWNFREVVDKEKKK